MAELRTRYPQIQITEINNIADKEIRQSFRNSMIMLLEGGILAIIAVWPFLRDIRATLISAAALPLAVIPTFWALHTFGSTMNTLTMLALTLVVGMLVDDAIVEVENIVRHLRMGKPPLQAATDAAIEIGLAVAATSLTLCAVFIPVSFMNGIPGELFKPFGFTAAIAVLFSLLVARTLTPMMASKFMRASQHGDEPGRFKLWYLEKTQWALKHRWKTLAASTTVMIGTFMLATTLPTGFAPASDFGSVNLSIELPPGARLQDTVDTVNQVRRRLAAYPEIESVFALSNPRSASLFITLKDRSEREATQQELQTRIVEEMASIPGARIRAGQGNGPPGTGRYRSN